MAHVNPRDVSSVPTRICVVIVEGLDVGRQVSPTGFHPTNEGPTPRKNHKLATEKNPKDTENRRRQHPKH